MNCTTIASVNQKGGQGKSQGAHALAMVLSDIHHRRVLLIDFDPQGAQRLLCGYKENVFDNYPNANVSLIFEGKLFDIEPITVSERVDAVFSDYLLSEYAERVIRNKENLLRKLVERFKAHYDYIIIDSQPTTGSLMSSVVLAADKLFVPVKTNILDESGTVGFLDEVYAIMEAYDKEIEKIILVPNLYESNVNDKRESLSNIKNNHPKYLKSLGYKGEVLVAPPIPKRSLFDSAASDPEVYNIVK
ncbi:MAG TPA: ParA family protein, partial [Epsilonproteobacteria bacterium]|nr:ParA family protein [Campylobacterota bacterium]